MMHCLVLILYLCVFSVSLVFGLHRCYLLYLCQRHRGHDRIKLQKVDEWPHVVIQLPIYNERYVLKRLLKAIAQLDYPVDKLHIQILDDSTDATRQLAERMAYRLRARGYCIDYYHRDTRQGFKAGALNLGLEHSAAEYIAIFDADFVPQPYFLKQTLPYLLAPKVGMVQTRWGHLNQHYSWLTRGQSAAVDIHFLIEQFARSQSGHFFHFNGSAGIWKKQAIEKAGRWHYDTLTEDLDLSYRAQLVGWQFIFLPNIVTPAELPIHMNAYKSQQHRWTKGAVQTLLKLSPQIWKTKLPLSVRIVAMLHLSEHVGHALLVLLAMLIFPIMHLGPSLNLAWLLHINAFLFLGLTIVSLLQYLYTFGDTRESSFGMKIIHIPISIALGVGLSLNNLWAVLEALLNRRNNFVRTPKYNIQNNLSKYSNRTYHPQKNWSKWGELLLGCYFLCTWVYWILNGYYSISIFPVLFLGGFFYVSLSSFQIDIRSSVRENSGKLKRFLTSPLRGTVK